MSRLGLEMEVQGFWGQGQGRGRGQARGQVEIAEEVIRTIAALAAAEVEGVSLGPGRRSRGRGKGVEVELAGEAVRIGLKVRARYGLRLPELGRLVQERVKREVEELTGLKVSAVDVQFDRLEPPLAEPEAETR